MQLKLISCEIFYRELCAAVSRSPNTVDVEFLPKGLHDIGCASMLARLQDVVDRVEEGKYQAVLLGYGLCNNGIVGLIARAVPIVIPRAHDCITLFLGNRRKYLDYFNSHPGVYFKTSGWIERGDSRGELRQLSIQRRIGLDSTYEELVEKYGEDNARYLWDEMCDLGRNYRQLTFIEMGVEPDDRFERQTREEAASRGWDFEKVKGDLSMIQRFVDGRWDEHEFLIVRPGSRVAPTYEDDIITLDQP
jgi:hypothetical protein